MKSNKEQLLLKSADDVGITMDQWLNHYNNNKGLYNYIFNQNVIIAKNGKYTISQEMEAITTTKNYQISFQEVEDLKQESILLMMEFISRRGTILYRYKYTIWKQCVQRAIVKHIRQQRRFFMQPKNLEVKIAWDQGERVQVDPGEYSQVDFKVDVKNLNTLNKKEKQIIMFLFQKYKQKEIASMLKISAQMVNKYIRQIRKKLEVAGLKTA